MTNKNGIVSRKKNILCLVVHALKGCGLLRLTLHTFVKYEAQVAYTKKNTLQKMPDGTIRFGH